MLDAERVDGFVLELPGDDRLPFPVAAHDASDELLGARQQRRVACRLHQGPLPQWLRQPVRWDEDLGITESLDRAHRQNDLLSGALRGIDLPVQVCRFEPPGLRLDPVPVRTQADQRIGERQQRLQGGTPIETERLSLKRTEADTEEG